MLSHGSESRTALCAALCANKPQAALLASGSAMRSSERIRERPALSIISTSRRELVPPAAVKAPTVALAPAPLLRLFSEKNPLKIRRCTYKYCLQYLLYSRLGCAAGTADDKANKPTTARRPNQIKSTAAELRARLGDSVRTDFDNQSDLSDVNKPLADPSCIQLGTASAPGGGWSDSGRRSGTNTLSILHLLSGRKRARGKKRP